MVEVGETEYLDSVEGHDVRLTLVSEGLHFDVFDQRSLGFTLDDECLVCVRSLIDDRLVNMLESMSLDELLIRRFFSAFEGSLVS